MVVDGELSVTAPAAGTWGSHGFACTEVVRDVDGVAGVLAQLERDGAGSVWFGEAVGGESFATSAVLLARSQRLVVAPGVANMAARTPAATAAGRRILADAYPGRFALGLGVSHDAIVREYGGTPQVSPLRALTDYLDAMAATPGGAGSPPAPTLVSALGPRMLALTAERGLGVCAWNVTPEHTATARQVLGSDGLLAPRQAVLLCEDAATARAVGREHLGRYLVYENYVRSWRRQGFDDGDLAGGGSDRLVDAMVAWGDVDVIVTRLGEVRDAGADHVVVHALARPGCSAVEALLEVSGALAGAFGPQGRR